MIMIKCKQKQMKIKLLYIQDCNVFDVIVSP